MRHGAALHLAQLVLKKKTRGKCRRFPPPQKSGVRRRLLCKLAVRWRLLSSILNAACLPVDGALAEKNDVACFGSGLHDDARQILMAATVNERRRRGEVGFVASRDGDEATRALSVIYQRKAAHF